MKKAHIAKLAITAIALLLIPTRSSRQAERPPYPKKLHSYPKTKGGQNEKIEPSVVDSPHF